MGIWRIIRTNLFLRNAVLAVCTLIVMVFLTGMILNFVTRHGQAIAVPDFNGMPLAEAQKIARKESLKLEINDSLYLPARTGGTVLEQNPSPGSQVKSGRRIFLTINSFRPKTAEIPYVTGYSLRQAKNNLEVAGFTIKELIYVPDLATNNVLEQRYDGRPVVQASHLEAPTGSGITLVVGRSEGAAAIRIPKVIGFPLAEARSRLWEVGLNVGRVVYGEGVTEVTLSDARIYRQTPNHGGSVALGTPATLYLTLDPEKVDNSSKESDRQARVAADTTHR
ncbi:MAG: PASTA domain-containing protein [Rikenellaceae bacterium]|jgi:beta-lactam-binding protein with PASTA domain|nr:PASTA domain-containing protein [Rikenellaceae bacterium]